jgi:hypothetical protein
VTERRVYRFDEVEDIVMPITLKDKMKELSAAQRKKVEARAADLIAEEMTLRELAARAQAHAGEDG